MIPERLSTLEICFVAVLREHKLQHLLPLLILIYTAYPLSSLVCYYCTFCNTEESPEGPKFLLIPVTITGLETKARASPEYWPEGSRRILQRKNEGVGQPAGGLCQ